MRQSLERALAAPHEQRMPQEQVEHAWNYAYRFFFDYPHPFPWHLLGIWDELEDWPLERVLSAEGQAAFGDTFRYLAGRAASNGAGRRWLRWQPWRQLNDAPRRMSSSRCASFTTRSAGRK